MGHPPKQLIRAPARVALAAGACAVLAAAGCSDLTVKAAGLHESCHASGGESRARVVSVTRDAAGDHVEPDLAVSRSRPGNLLVASQLQTAPRTRIPAVYASIDGGRTWPYQSRLRLPHGFVLGADTTVAFSPHGVGFVSATLAGAAGRGSPSRVKNGGIFVWRTTDQGRSFAAPVAVYRAPRFEDHPWLATDPGTGTDGVLDEVWQDSSGLLLAQSRDGGHTFSRARLVVPSRNAIDPVAVARGDGTVAVFWQQLGPNQITLYEIRSSDHGHTFGPPVKIGAAPEAALPRPGHSKTGLVIPLVAAAISPTGHEQYIALSEFGSAAGVLRVLVWQSHNDGMTWDQPARLNDPGTAALSQIQPRIAISARQTASLLYLTESRHGVLAARLASFPDASVVSGRSRQLNASCLPAGQFIGDYQGLAYGPTALYAAWNSAIQGRLQILVARLPWCRPSFVRRPAKPEPRDPAALCVGG